MAGFSGLAPPPPPEKFDLEPWVWNPGDLLYRISPDEAGGTEYADCKGGARRFSPLESAGVCVGALYAADSPHAAVKETVFHDLEAGGERSLAISDVLSQRISRIVPRRRALTFARFDDDALGALPVTREELIESRDYAATAPWALRVFELGESGDLPKFDGVTWNSRLDRNRRSVMLFGTRVNRIEELRATVPQALAQVDGPGFTVLLEVADELGVTITGIDEVLLGDEP